MFRVGVSLYLMLTTLAGPWLCCCTSIRLLSAATPASRAEGGDLPCVVHSCCHNRTDTARHKNSERQPPKKTPSPDKSCPCRQGHLNVASLPSQTSQLAQNLLDALSSVSLFGAPSAQVAAGPLQGPDLCTLSTGWDHPFLTTQDLLRTLHILRC
jgi:hypothetical protein